MQPGQSPFYRADDARRSGPSSMPISRVHLVAKVHGSESADKIQDILLYVLFQISYMYIYADNLFTVIVFCRNVCR